MQSPAYHNTQTFFPPTNVEVENLSLPTMSLDPFSEDEDKILFDQPDVHDKNIDVHPLQ